MLKNALLLLILFCLPHITLANANNINQEEQSLNRQNTSDWWLSSRIYHIWVRSFMDSDDDGIGDLKGIVSKLDYLKELGVNTLLLSPIFESPSYHGYDVTDHMQIDSDYGTEEDFRALLSAAHVMGIKVLLDFPINHVSHQHKWFENSLEQKEPYTNYFRWQADLPADYGYPWDTTSPATATWHHKPNREGYYYGLFGYDNPDLNFLNQDVQQEMFKIAKFWLNQGVDGFRIDAARHLVEEGPNPLQADTASNLEFLRALVKNIKKENKNAFVIGEALTDLRSSKSYLTGKYSLDALFNFEFHEELKALYGDNTYFKNSENATARSSVADIYLRLTKHKQTNKEYVVFLNNHDFPRFTSNQKEEMVIRKIMATLMVLSPFSSAIYYGDEVGMDQSRFDDHSFSRAPMQWNDEKNAGFTKNPSTWIDDPKWFPWRNEHSVWFNARLQNQQSRSVSEQQSDQASLYNHYKTLMLLKAQDTVLVSPDTFQIVDAGEPHVFAAIYKRNGQKRLILVNLNPYKAKVAKLQNKLVNTFYIEGANVHIGVGEFIVFATTEPLNSEVED